MKKMHKNLFKQLKLDNLPADEKIALSEDLGEVVMQRLAFRLEAILTPDQVKEFESKLETDEAEALALLLVWVPTFSAIAQEEIDGVREELLYTHSAVMENLKNKN